MNEECMDVRIMYQFRIWMYVLPFSVNVCGFLCALEKKLCGQGICMFFVFCACVCECVCVYVCFLDRLLHRSLACCVCTAALPFPDESRCACPLMLTLPHAIKACWTTSATHSHFPLNLTLLPVHSAICCQLNLLARRRSKVLTLHTDYRYQRLGTSRKRRNGTYYFVV